MGKKYSKFKCWLIKKLGGEIPVPYSPIIIEKHIPIKRFEYTLHLTKDENDWYDSFMMDKKESILKERLWDKMGQDISQYISIDCAGNEELGTIECSGRITIALE